MNKEEMNAEFMRRFEIARKAHDQIIVDALSRGLKMPLASSAKVYMTDELEEKLGIRIGVTAACLDAESADGMLKSIESTMSELSASLEEMERKAGQKREFEHSSTTFIHNQRYVECTIWIKKAS